MKEKKLLKTYAIPLKNTVLFPNIVSHIIVEREKSLESLHKGTIKGNDEMIFTAQREDTNTVIGIADVYHTGVLAKIIQMIKLPKNSIKLVVKPIHRVKIEYFKSRNPYLCHYELIKEQPFYFSDEMEEDIEELIELSKEWIKINKKINNDILCAILEHKNPVYLVNFIAANLIPQKPIQQKALEINDLEDLIKYLRDFIRSEIIIHKTEKNIKEAVKSRLEKIQKDYYLNEQMKIIQKELGNDEKSEIQELENKIQKTELSTEARNKAQEELKKLKLMNPITAEAGISRNYLELLLSLPWGKTNASNIDIRKTIKILDEDHYGMEKPKERIIEFLAVLQRAKKLNGAILCFIGPPGVGKTSLVKSIAKATGRKYAKFSLGGLRDEAEIRGHRKTYIGSMPGKIINLIKKSGTDNPVMLLDEIDKMGSDFRGDPTSAFLEVLDPEQNKNFVDHYLEVEYDLSNIIFIATANTYNLPKALLDRMEIIQLSGYIENEKLEIAKKYLIPNQLKNHGMKKSEFKISDDTILNIIRFYTKESGVRGLEREINKLLRKSLTTILNDTKIKSVTITPEILEKFLGVKKYKFNTTEANDVIGSTTGLAYTEVGGDLLSIEAVTIPGKGEIKATGKLGEVMKESTQAAFSFFKSKADLFGVKQKDYKTTDIHVHVPEGATPKDGPSAGIAIFTSIVSIMTQTSVKKDVAMTGEITLQGKILPIGGLREKLLAASRGNIKTVIIPKENEKDLKEIPSVIMEKLNIIPLSNACDVLNIALSNIKFSIS